MEKVDLEKVSSRLRAYLKRKTFIKGASCIDNDSLDLLKKQIKEETVTPDDLASKLSFKNIFFFSDFLYKEDKGVYIYDDGVRSYFLAYGGGDHYENMCIGCLDKDNLYLVRENYPSSSHIDFIVSKNGKTSMTGFCEFEERTLSEEEYECLEFATDAVVVFNAVVEKALDKNRTLCSSLTKVFQYNKKN